MNRSKPAALGKRKTTAKGALPTAAFAQGLGRRSEQILLTLRDNIERGVFTGGSKLPTESALCQRFASSRPTVRRAIARLVEEGRITVRRGSGMYVCGRPVASVSSKTLSVMFEGNSELLTILQDYALARGYLICVFSQVREHWNPAAERRFLELALAQRHKAVLAFCSPLQPGNDDMLQRLEQTAVQVIHTEHYRLELPEQNYLLPDYRQGGHMAAVALMLAGYQRIMLVRSNVVAPSSQLLEMGFAQALAEHGGRPYDPRRDCFHVPPGLDSHPATQRTVENFWKTLPANVGLVLENLNMSTSFRDGIARRLDVPQQVGLLAVGTVNQDDGVPQAVDTLQFSRQWILQRAADLAVRPKGGSVRELVAPIMIRRGTVRQQRG